MKKWIIPAVALMSLQVASSCGDRPANDNANVDTLNAETVGYDPNFKVEAEAFADLQLLRYEVPGFNQLSLKEKQLAYYLYEAALCGRDMIYDQKNKYGLTIRKTIEAMYGSYKGEKTSDDWRKFETYCGRVWFSNGNYHHYSNEKFIPECSFEYFTQVANNCDQSLLPIEAGETTEAFLTKLKPALYDMSFMPKLVDQRADIDNVAMSANNFYEGVTGKEVDDFYAKFPTSGNAQSWGLNSKVMKDANGQIVEKVWKLGGM
jgi:dipeptidyl-peptidase-3